MYIMTPLLWAAMQCGVVNVYRRCRGTGNSIFENKLFEKISMCIYIHLLHPTIPGKQTQQTRGEAYKLFAS